MSDYLKNKAIQRISRLPEGSRSRSRLLRTYKLTEQDLISEVETLETKTSETGDTLEIQKVTKVKPKKKSLFNRNKD